MLPNSRTVLSNFESQNSSGNCDFSTAQSRARPMPRRIFQGKESSRISSRRSGGARVACRTAWRLSGMAQVIGFGIGRVRLRTSHGSFL